MFLASKGSPRAELWPTGEIVSGKTVAKLMRQEALVARARKRSQETTDSKRDNLIAANIIERDFVAVAKNGTWVADLTCIWARAGWLFMAVILDLLLRRVVGWPPAPRTIGFLRWTLRATMANRRPLPGLAHHLDCGSSYASADCADELQRFGIVVSMSRRAIAGTKRWQKASSAR